MRLVVNNFVARIWKIDSMTDADRAALKAKSEQWREIGLRMCPKVKQPYGGWSRQEYMDRPIGALHLIHADELSALIAAGLSEAPAPQEKPK